MGRKSLADERREEIVAAFERCIARYGLEAPLERIAAEAGMQRSLIRHYLGNRDQLVTEVISRLVAQTPQRVAEGLARAAARGNEGLLDFLFHEPLEFSDSDTILLAVIGSAQDRYPQAKQQIVQMSEAIVAQFAVTLGQLFPAATADRCADAAYGLFCLYQTNDLLCWLGIDAGYSVRARSSARQLLEQLSQA